MKLDKSKPYGTVMGHPAAAYEQNGVLFDGGGDALTEVKEAVVKKEVAAVARNIDESVGFLKSYLAGGPMSENKIKVEGENQGFSWDDLSSAQATMNLRKYKQGAATMWTLID